MALELTKLNESIATRLLLRWRRDIYKVLIDDNFHYQDGFERVTEGVFATADEALAACRAIVDGFLTDAFQPGMSSEALFEHYTTFGEDPFVLPVDAKSPRVKFSAWDYARQRCEEIAGV